MVTARKLNLDLEDEVTRLEMELRLYKNLKLSSIERKLNELLDQLDDPATPQTKGQRLRERLGIIAATVALAAIAQSKFELPLVFHQGTKHEQVTPKFSSSSAPSLDKVESTPAKQAPQLETKPQLNSTPSLASSSAPSLDKVESTPAKQAPQLETKPQLNSTPSLASSSAPSLDKVESTPAKQAPQLETKPQLNSTPSLDALMRAIATQESGGNHSLINPDSGATGKWQVMPANIGEWSQAALGYKISHSEFLASPELQRKIVAHRLGLYLSKQSVPGRSEEEVIRRVASAWYSGRPSLWANERPQGKYPSIASYTKSVWSLYCKAKSSPSPLDKTRQLISTWPEEFQKDPAAGDTIAGYQITSARGMRISPTSGQYKMHQGIDVGTPIGTPIRAIADGQLQCGYWPDAGIVGLFTSDEFPGLRFDLLHLSRCVGNQGSKISVQKGDVIGWTGTAGTGPHLHLAIKNESGKFLRVRAGWVYWFLSGKSPSQK
jgi:murein DD-endopeptidase MepM/ murein hydrolase activator NlpD